MWVCCNRGTVFIGTTTSDPWEESEVWNLTRTGAPRRYSDVSVELDSDHQEFGPFRNIR